MQFRNIFTLLLSALPLTLAAELGNNAITAPIAGDVITAGETYAIKWTNIKGNSVTLILVDGPADQVKPVEEIITNTPNTGVFTWNVPKDLPASKTYAIRISYNNNPADYNYSDRFIFENESTVSSVSSRAETSTAPSTKTASSVASSETESATSENETATTTAISTESEATTTEASTKSESKTETATSNASETTGSTGPSQTTVSRAAKTTSQTIQTEAPVDRPSSASRSISGSFIAAVAGMMIGGALLL